MCSDGLYVDAMCNGLRGASWGQIYRPPLVIYFLLMHISILLSDTVGLHPLLIPTLAVFCNALVLKAQAQNLITDAPDCVDVFSTSSAGSTTNDSIQPARFLPHICMYDEVEHTLPLLAGQRLRLCPRWAQIPHIVARPLTLFAISHDIRYYTSRHANSFSRFDRVFFARCCDTGGPSAEPH